MAISILIPCLFLFTDDPEPTTTLPIMTTAPVATSSVAISPVANTSQWLAPIDCSSLPSGRAHYIGHRRRYDVGPGDHNEGVLSWDEARNYCQRRGGELAVTGMDSLATRL